MLISAGFIAQGFALDGQGNVREYVLSQWVAILTFVHPLFFWHFYQINLFLYLKSLYSCQLIGRSYLQHWRTASQNILEYIVLF